mgnify:CR=1 FL=1
MKRDKLFRLSLAILFLWTSLALAAPAAMAASSTALPGSSLWEPYLQQSRIDLEKAASSPWETLKSFLPRSFGALVRQTASRYTSVLLFLTLAAVLGLFAGECTDGALLDLVAAGGCGVLLWGSLLEEARKLCEQVESWRSFLLGFLPVYAGVLTMGGEGAAGSAASGALLTALCFLAQLAAAFVQPLLHCYLMLSMACCVSSEPALGVFCKGVGSALRQALGWAGKILVALLGLQRAAAFQLDRFSLRTGQLLAGSVPIIGQTLSSASESILAGIQLLKSGLGLAALSVLGAEFVRDVEPGEIVTIDSEGIRSRDFSQYKRCEMCSMEYIYFARPDSDIEGCNVHAYRKESGRLLFGEAPAEADIVVGVPDSSLSAAMGYAEASGLPYEMGLIKNKYIGRTFIQPSQELREKGVRMKLSAVRTIVKGKRVVLVDDSIVRGTTSRRIVTMLKEAGATEVHVRIASPPMTHPCFYGVDTSTRDELISARKEVDGVRAEICADSLAFLSPGALLRAGNRKDLCMACFTGHYPTALYQSVDEVNKDVKC